MMEWVTERGFDPNDPRNHQLLELRKLVESVCGAVNPDAPLAYWKGKEFFRIGLPRWLFNLTMGVGVYISVT